MPVFPLVLPLVDCQGTAGNLHKVKCREQFHTNGHFIQNVLSNHFPFKSSLYIAESIHVKPESEIATAAVCPTKGETLILT